MCYDRIVAPDGSGTDRSVQAAVDALEDRADRERILLIRRGIYRERVVINKPRVRLIGEDPESCEIVWNGCAKDPDAQGREKGTFLSFSVLTAAPDITLENLTIRNDAGDGRLVGQAVALYAAGDRNIVRNCRLLAHQDTLFCGPLMPRVEDEIAPRRAKAECVPSVSDCPETESRLYFERCLIQGDVDFIFGSYRSFFEECELRMNERGGWYTAANTAEGQPWGLVFRHCHLTGECGPRMAYLGRPWRAFARTVFLDCEMDACVSPVGFVDWDEFRVVTDRLGEGGTRGEGAAPSARHPKSRLWTPGEAAAVTPELVLNGWNPLQEK